MSRHSLSANDDMMKKMYEKLLVNQGSLPEAPRDIDNTADNTIKPSNQLVLGITCTLFSLFVVAEVIGATVGHSLALLGDAAAMSVDVFNYLSNMYAEYVKSQGRALTLRQQFIMEVLVPLCSVTALLTVTGYVAAEAIIMLIHSNSGEEEDDVNVYIMFGFAGVNLLIDIISAGMFYLRGKEGFVNESSLPRLSERASLRSSFLTSDSIVTIIVKRSNLNMMSALTAVTGDTLRTISVLIAALVNTTAGVPGNICDAWAAIIVTVTVVSIAIALVSEIYRNAKRFL